MADQDRNPQQQKDDQHRKAPDQQQKQKDGEHQAAKGHEPAAPANKAGEAAPASKT